MAQYYETDWEVLEKHDPTSFGELFAGVELVRQISASGAEITHSWADEMTQGLAERITSRWYLWSEDDRRSTFDVRDVDTWRTAQGRVAREPLIIAQRIMKPLLHVADLNRDAAQATRKFRPLFNRYMAPYFEQTRRPRPRSGGRFNDEPGQRGY